MAIEQWGLFSVPHLLWHGIPFSLNPFTVSLYLPLEKDVVYHLERLKYTLYPRMICSSAQCFFPNSVYVLVFSLFRKYLPKCRTFYWSKSESSLPKIAMSQVWLLLAHWFWKGWKCENFTPTTTTILIDKFFRSEKLTWSLAHVSNNEDDKNTSHT